MDNQRRDLEYNTCTVKKGAGRDGVQYFDLNIVVQVRGEKAQTFFPML